MNRFAAAQCLVIATLISACSSETAKRTAYETLQNIHEQECLKDPNLTSDCGKRDSYEDYQRQRKELDPAE